MQQEWLYHNSHDVCYRSPFGAVSYSQTVTLRLKVVAVVPPETVFVRLWQENRGEEKLPMQLWRQEDDIRWYQCEFDAPAVSGLVWYYFLVRKDDQEYCYGNNAQSQGGVGQISHESPPSYQITVYDPAATTPAWFKNAIIYQVFVDRFRNGNPDNGIHNAPPGALLHAYWDDIPFYVRDMRTGRIFAYDFFGGNLRGVMKKLPYLKTLGVTAIYFNPIFTSSSNHKYDTGDYKQIDPMFGDNDLFAALCAKAGEMGISIILDGVFSHTGSDSRYFNRYGRYPDVGAWQSPASPYFKWYRFSEYPYQYEAWWGIDTLPNVDELEPSYLDFMLEGPDSVLKYWLKLGVKGWRLDVADELPDEFIRRFHRIMKTMDRNHVLIGEVWEDASRKVSYGATRQYLLGNELDSVMNYPLRKIMLEFLLQQQNAEATGQAILSLYENYPKEHFYATMNLIGSHDVPRILTLLGEAPLAEGMTIMDQAQYRLPPERRKLATARLKLMVLWQMTMPGAPCIYYGDEAGMEGYADPFNRGTYPWDGEDQALLLWYRKLTALRQQYAVLRTGEWRTIVAERNIYGYMRCTENGVDAFGEPCPGNTAIILLNRDAENTQDIVIKVAGCHQKNFFDPLKQERLPVTGEVMNVTLGPLAGRLLLAVEETGDILTRGSGVLLHPTSLPSPYGIGDLGTEAYAFVDWLRNSGQKYWQILPLNPPGYGDSPYQSVSAFAGNVLLVSPELLVADGLVDAEHLNNSAGFTNATVEYQKTKLFKSQLLRQAYKRFKAHGEAATEYRDFIRRNSGWLEDFSLFMALKDHFDGQAWNNWDHAVAAREPAVLRDCRMNLADAIGYYRFEQYIFYRQWRRLKQYANQQGVQIIGDLPIFVAHDSADVWANQRLFDLDEAGGPAGVAGVPPDYFSSTGQLWGNPLYDWEAMAGDGFWWWRQRFMHMLNLMDIIRIDHFRGLEAYWRIPAGEPTAMHGQWVKGPGAEFFAVIRHYLGDLPIVAEDLGVITPEVIELRTLFRFPGMKVLQFLLEAGDDPCHSVDAGGRATILYTGTHDNDTTAGWYRHCREERPMIAAGVRNIVGLDTGAKSSDVCDKIIEYAYYSKAQAVIVPVQDILGLGSEARMNLPGTVGGNWAWRMPCRLSSELAAKLHALAERTGR